MASYIPVDLRNQVRACDRNRCCYCKTSEALSGIRMAFDHIHPRSKGVETCSARPTQQHPAAWGLLVLR